MVDALFSVVNDVVREDKLE